MRTPFIRWAVVTLIYILASAPSARAGSEDVPIVFFSAPQSNAPQAAYSSPPPYYGDNLPASIIKAKLIAAGQKYKIPPHVLFGIAYQESVWKQFRTDRRTTYHLEPDGRVGVGMMQMTVSPSAPDYERLCTDVDYNIEQAAILLNGKWRATPIIGDNARDKLENWYFAIWAYNGFICPNPNNYAPTVLAHIASGRSLWTPVSVTAPNVNNNNCSLSRIDSTPSPIHIDSNYDGVIDATLSQRQPGTLLFEDDFDDGQSGANWTTNTSIPNTTESSVDYAYDYSQLGIPAAPRSVGGTTLGTRFLVNQGTNVSTTSGNLQGISASPTGKSFSGNFRIRFDLWINYVGSLGTGGTSIPPGSGSTQMASMGWGTDGTLTQWSGSAHSVMFSADGDGGTAADYRAYRASTALLATSSGAYAAGTGTDANNSSNAYYDSFGDKTAPDQAALFPSQSGITPSGALGMAWRDVIIEKSGNTLTWTVDGKRIASVDATGAALGGANLFLGMFDINATASSADDRLNAAIYDNLTVTTLPDTSGAILSEFRFRGPGGSLDEYVELFNAQAAPLDISGWSIQTNSNTLPAPVFKVSTVPNGTILPPRGHFLFTGAAYSLKSYGTGDAALNGDASDASGVALFNALGQVQDAVGFAGSVSSLREGAGLASAPNVAGEYAWMRDFVGAVPKDSADSSADFVFVAADANSNLATTTPSVAGTSGAVASQLGAPSPENLASPVLVNDQIVNTLFDPNAPQSAPPNRVRSGTGNAGTLLIRRTLKNTTSRALSRVRFLVTRTTADGSALLPGQTLASQAILRLTSAPNEPGVLLSDGTSVPVSGTSLEAGAAGLPTQTLGGGLGSSTSFNSVLAMPLLPGESRSYAFLLQIVKSGNFSIQINIQALPAS